VEKSVLDQQLELATARAVAFARLYCHQTLLGPVKYRVCPCQSFDDNRQSDEYVFPDDGYTPDDVLGPWSAAEVVAWMWRGGRVPVWVDVSVFSEVSGEVVVQLLCAGRFSENPKRLYYECDGQSSPFGIKSPSLPPDWSEGEKFDVGWHLQRGA
jgi:hypothetical protein